MSDMTGKVDNPEAFCAAKCKEETGEWPAEESIRQRISKAYQKQLREGFSWVGKIDIESLGFAKSNLVKVVALHPITTYHPGQWPEIRHYVEPELEKVARSFKGGYINLDHYWLYNPPYEIVSSEWEDGRIEMLCYVPDEIITKIKNGQISKVSVDMDWKILRNMNGVIPEGLTGLGVAFLEKLTPGDPHTSVELWNAWGEVVRKTWKGRPETVKLNEAILPRGITVPKVLQEFYGEAEYVLGFWRDPALFMEEHFQSFYIDKGRGIQAIIGRLRSTPEKKLFQSIFFSRDQHWTDQSIKEWFADHPRYISKAYSPKLLQEGGSPKVATEIPAASTARKKIMSTKIKHEGNSGAQRAKDHFDITDEKWDAMTDEEKQAKIDALPELEETGIRFQDGKDHGCGDDEVWDAEADACVAKKTASEAILNEYYTKPARTIVRKLIKEGKITFQDVLPEPSKPPTETPGAPPEVEHPACVVGTTYDKEQKKCVPSQGAVEPITDEPPVSPSVGVPEVSPVTAPETSPSIGELIEAGKKLKEMRSAEEVKTELTTIVQKREELYSQVDALWPQEEALQAELEAIIQAEVGAAIAEPMAVEEGMKWLVTDAMPTIIGEQEEEGPFQCPYCEAEPFDTKEALETHISTDHSEALQEFWGRSYRLPTIAKFVKEEGARRLEKLLTGKMTPTQKMASQIKDMERRMTILVQQATENEQRWIRSPHYKTVSLKMAKEIEDAKRAIRSKEIQLKAVTDRLEELGKIIKEGDAVSRQQVLELLAPTFPTMMGGRGRMKTTVGKGHYQTLPGLPAHTIIRNRLERIRSQVKGLPTVL